MFKHGDKSQDVGKKKHKMDNNLRRSDSSLSMNSRGSAGSSTKTQGSGFREPSGSDSDVDSCNEKGVNRSAGTERSLVHGERNINGGGNGYTGGSAEDSQSQQEKQQSPRHKKKDSRIRKGPDLLRRTLSSLSLGSAKSENDDMPSGQESRQRQQESMSSAASGRRSFHGSSRHASQNDSGLGSHPRKTSLAGSFFKKLSGAGNSDGESGSTKEGWTKHGTPRGSRHHHGSLHTGIYNNMASAASSRRSSRDPAGNASVSGNASSSASGRGNIIDNVPHTLRQKVSTLVHGFGHDIEQSSSHAGKHLLHREKHRDSGRDPDVTHAANARPRISSDVPSSRRNSAASTLTNNSIASMPVLSSEKRGSSPKVQSQSRNQSGGVFQLDTNLENVSDITKAPELSRKSSRACEAHDSRVPSISGVSAKSVTHVNSSSDIPALSDSMAMNSIPSGTKQQWIAPESWDVESPFDVRRLKRHSKSSLNQEQLASQKKSKQQREEEIENGHLQKLKEKQKDRERLHQHQTSRGFVDASSTFPSSGEFTPRVSSSDLSPVGFSDSESSSSDVSTSDEEDYLGQGIFHNTNAYKESRQLPSNHEQAKETKEQSQLPNLSQKPSYHTSQGDIAYSEDSHRAGQEEKVRWNQKVLHEQALAQKQEQQEGPLDGSHSGLNGPSNLTTETYDMGSGDQEMKGLSCDDEKHDRVEYELERYYKDFSDLDPQRHYAIRIFNTDDTFTTLSCTPATTVRDILPSLKRKFNVTSQGSYQISLKVGKLSKILRPLSKPIIIERKLLLLNGYKKTDPLHIMGIEDLSFVFEFLFHPVAPSHLTPEQERRLMRSDFIHVDLRGMDLTTPPIIFYQHTSEIESLDVSNNANIFLPEDFVESATKLSSLRMVNIRASKFPSNICELDELVSLELQRNFIRKVPHTISQLPNLTILNLQCNELDKLPYGFSQLKNLQLLDLSSNRFVYYPEVVNECLNLLQINLSYNKIHTLPSTINMLVKLAKMNLSHNKLGIIPDLCGMKNLRTLNLKHNRITHIRTGASNLQNLSLTDNRISAFDDNLPKLKSLELQENPITSISYTGFSSMNMTNLSLSKAKLSALPGELFLELRFLEKLDVSENNITKLPDEFYHLDKLVHLSIAKNKLQRVPANFQNLKSLRTLDVHSNNIRDFAPGLENLDIEFLNISSNMFGNSCLMGPFCQNISSDSRISKSLEFLIAADNQFNDQMWPLFNCFTNLKVLNLSYNDFQDISNLKLENLTSLYFSGNKLATVSGDVVLKWKNLKTLMLNGNYLLSLPAELSQLTDLRVFDVGSNQLKYNISNYHYDWNWRNNKRLKYLNFSGNRRFEIRSSVNADLKTDLSDLGVLPCLKVLGLMDVTLNTTKVPDENVNFRLRTSGSTINGMRYGVADTLGKREFVSSRDVTFERFGGKDDECLLCLHDGKNQYADYGHNIARLVRDIYDKILLRELEKYGNSDLGIRKALRFSFLQLNKEVNGMLSQVDNGNSMANLTSADLLSGACSTVVYIRGNQIYTANIGDCMAIISETNGDFQKLTSLHVPYKREEYERIRISGGYVNDDKLDGVVDVSRAVGFFDLLPHIHASPDISMVRLTKTDEMLVIATHKLWRYMDFETACDIARENGSEPMLAAEAMKDHAIAYGCSDNLTIMCLSLHKDSDQQNRFLLNRNSLITRRNTFEDSTLRRLQPEIAPPTGNLAIVFTDIKNSTFLWEMFPNAMRTAIKTHNDIMRRLLRICGGYEVKTEGDAFMVAFPTPISALVWCFSVQLKFLEAQWPEEITSIQDGCLIIDKHGNKIYQGLSVRMGVHWGCPVPELDLVTQRMDYLGPMVNKAARVEGVADGGQITLSSDFLSEFNKIMRFHETVVRDKRPLKEVYGEEFVGEVLEKEISMLENIGWAFFDHGEQKLKGLETKELITIAYPKSLVSRHNFITKDEEARLLSEEFIYRLRSVSRRLESVLAVISKGFVDEHRNAGRTSSIDETVKASVKFLASERDGTAFFDDLVTRLEATIALLKLHQVMRKGFRISSEDESYSVGPGIFQVLDAVLEKIK